MTASVRQLGWVAIFAVGIATLFVATTVEGPPRTNEDRVRSLSEDFACPTCDGQSVAESNAVAAEQIRLEIRKLVDDGRSDEEITDSLIASFDESIDLRPRSSGVVGLVWTLPIIAMVFGFAALAAVFRRWRLAEQRSASADDIELVESLRKQRHT